MSGKYGQVLSKPLDGLKYLGATIQEGINFLSEPKENLPVKVKEYEEAFWNNYARSEDEEQYLVDGAKLSCNQATMEHQVISGVVLCAPDAKYDMTTTLEATGTAEICERKMAVIDDTNIEPIKCNCKKFPVESVETALVISDPACLTEGTCKWLMNLNDRWFNLSGEGSSFYLSSGKMVEPGRIGITMSSMLYCRHGGIIYPVDSGQVAAENMENILGFLLHKYFDINLKSAIIIAKAILLSEKYVNDNFESIVGVINTNPQFPVFSSLDQTNETLKHLAAMCVEYGNDIKWYPTASIPSTGVAMEYFIKCGMSTEEVKDMLLAINMQRRAIASDDFAGEYNKMQELGKMYGFTISMDEVRAYENPNPDGKNDFAHLIVASASIFAQDSFYHDKLNWLMLREGSANYENELIMLSSIKGDIYSAGNLESVEEALPEADYTSDLDCFNISNRVKNGDVSYSEAMVEYYTDLQNGSISREYEFIENFGEGTMEENFELFKEQMEMTDVGTRFISGKNNETLIEEAKEMVYDRIYEGLNE